MERGQDHFQRGFAGILGVFIDRDAAAVVADGDASGGAGLFLQRDFDAVGVTGDRFVHGVVEHFGNEMVERAFIGAADIHAGAATDRFESFEDFDGGAVVAFRRRRTGLFVEQVIGHGQGHSGTGNPGARRRWPLSRPFCGHLRGAAFRGAPLGP
jgi:hypothetical protein